MFLQQFLKSKKSLKDHLALISGSFTKHLTFKSQCSFLVIAYGGHLLLVKLCTLFLEHVKKCLRTLQNLVERTLRFLDGLVVFVAGGILFGEWAIDNFQSVGKRFHLLFDLTLFLFFLIYEILNLSALLIDALHHLDQLCIGVVQMAWSHSLISNSK